MCRDTLWIRLIPVHGTKTRRIVIAKTLKVGNYELGGVHPVFVIAEAGVNHNGDIELAKELIRKAKQCGADCVKFQTFKAEQVVSAKAPKAVYQLKTTDPGESQIDMLRALELSEDAYPELLRICEEEDILFLSTPYNFEDADFLDRLGVTAFKIASGQLIEHPFLEHVAKKGKPVILSTGMGTLKEVEEAIEVIHNAGNDKIIVLQCTTNYPSPIEETNLRAMITMRNKCKVLVGYSDHTCGNTATMAAVSLNACLIEKHFTLDKGLPGPDQASSADPEEFSELVRLIRETEKCLGTPDKKPSPQEIKNIQGMRRSLASSRNISAESIISWDNVTFKRPATGIPGNQSHMVLGKKARQDIPADTLITPDMIE